MEEVTFGYDNLLEEFKIRNGDVSESLQGNVNKTLDDLDKFRNSPFIKDGDIIKYLRGELETFVLQLDKRKNLKDF